MALIWIQKPQLGRIRIVIYVLKPITQVTSAIKTNNVKIVVPVGKKRLAKFVENHLSSSCFARCRLCADSHRNKNIIYIYLNIG